MSVINILSPHVADLIAAGEVVERPASVIKELMENSLDAKAKNITVEIKGRGSAYIRVTDDGVGMAPEDAGIAFLRHATSKLHDAEGLAAIGTMGFRGEALAAISSVSRIELTTRRREDNEGTRLTLEAGEIQDMYPFGCPVGTTIIVRDLFYNTPARLKFLKTDRSENSACILTALRVALGHPEVSVRFIRDGQEEFFSPGDGRADSCIYTLLGRDVASTLLKCENEEEGITVSGYTSSPSAGRGNRSMQYFFCNGRYIKSQLLQTAVEQAYKNTLLTGRYPACVIYLKLDLSEVDVNVHPAKTEVKFSYEKRVFDAVYRAVGLALTGESITAKPELSQSTRNVTAPKENFYRSISAKEFRENGYAVTKNKPAALSSTERPYITSAQSLSREKASADYTKITNSAPQNIAETTACTPEKSGQNTTYSVSPAEGKSADRQSAETEICEKTALKSENPLPEDVENSVENVENVRNAQHKIVGEAFKTYIIVEQDSTLTLIDKHAAHERIIFDRLKAQDREIAAQSLLIPATVKLSGEDAELIEQNGELLYELGFEIEPFGEDSFVIRAVPADMDSPDAAAAIEEICEKLRRGKLDAKSARDEILHTVACRAAIKAGWDTQPLEREKLVEEVLSGRVKYCPHGRPVAVTLTKTELDKMFKRIV
jgi:DNA mismatch repair protein MutL